MRRGTRMKGATLAGVVLTVAATVMLFSPRNDSHASDLERGRLLYENHCTVCHTSIVHIRERRKAMSRDDVRMWIRRWQEQLKLQWGTVEIDDVTEFLNDQYYGFKSES